MLRWRGSLRTPLFALEVGGSETKADGAMQNLPCRTSDPLRVWGKTSAKPYSRRGLLCTAASFVFLDIIKKRGPFGLLERRAQAWGIVTNAGNRTAFEGRPALSQNTRLARRDSHSREAKMAFEGQTIHKDQAMWCTTLCKNWVKAPHGFSDREPCTQPCPKSVFSASIHCIVYRETVV